MEWTKEQHARVKDEVSNGARLDRDESWEALKEIERGWAEIERLAEKARDLDILSAAVRGAHGLSEGATVPDMVAVLGASAGGSDRVVIKITDEILDAVAAPGERTVVGIAHGDEVRAIVERGMGLDAVLREAVAEVRARPEHKRSEDVQHDFPKLYARPAADIDAPAMRARAAYLGHEECEWHEIDEGSREAWRLAARAAREGMPAPTATLPENVRAAAAELLACAVVWDPSAKVLGNVSAALVADIAREVLAGEREHAETRERLAETLKEATAATNQISDLHAEIASLRAERDILIDDLATAQHAETRWQERYHTLRAARTPPARPALTEERAREIAKLVQADVLTNPEEWHAKQIARYLLAAASGDYGTPVAEPALTCAECREPIGPVAHVDCDAPAQGIVGRGEGYTLATTPEPERTPETVLRAMLRAYEAAALEAAIAYFRFPDDTEEEAAEQLDYHCSGLRDAVAFAVSIGDYARILEVHGLLADYEARLSGARPLHAPPMAGETKVAPVCECDPSLPARDRCGSGWVRCNAGVRAGKHLAAQADLPQVLAEGQIPESARGFAPPALDPVDLVRSIEMAVTTGAGAPDTNEGEQS